MFFHCQTDLVDTFRELYPKLSYSGNRAILLDAGKKLPEAELRHCVALALTYHLRKRLRVRRRCRRHATSNRGDAVLVQLRAAAAACASGTTS
jgi:hypothetical protein